MAHDHGFKADFPHFIGRRAVLSGMAGLVASAASAQACVVASSETQGPFPADGSNRMGLRKVNVLTEAGVQREDLRTSFAGLSPVADGVELALNLQLVNAGDSCGPLDGYAIYAWHCDAAGRYSIYQDEDRNYLRGVGISDAEGKVTFTTVFPGCYRGRWPHIHFEVFDSADSAVAGRNSLVTSQLSFDAETCAAIYDADGRYAASVRPFNDMTFEEDGVFGDNTDAENAQQMIEVSGDIDGPLAGTCLVGVPA